MRTGIWLGIGFAFGLGALAGWTVGRSGGGGSPAPSEAASAVTPRLGTPSDSSPQRGPTVSTDPATPVPAVPAACAAYAAETERLRTANAVLERQIASLGGARAEWPEQVPEPFRAASVRAWLDQELRGQPLELEELACDEYPCVAVFRFAAGQPASSAVLDPLRESFSARAGGTFQPQISVFAGDDVVFGALALRPDDLPPEAEERLGVRLEDLGEIYLQP